MWIASEEHNEPHLLNYRVDFYRKAIRLPLRLSFQERVSVVKNRILCGALSVVLTILVGLFSLSLAQKNRAASVTTPASTLLTSLPTSDAIVLINVKRVLDEALPKLLSGNPAKLAEAKAEIEQFKTRTGIDLRSFDQIAFGMRYTYPSAGITKVNTVALASGSSNTSAIVAAGRMVANGKYQEQKYQSKTIYIFTLDQQAKLFGLWDVRVKDLAVCPLDSKTLALGDLQSVRATIDVVKGRSRANAELIALASHDPNAIVGFGGNISRALLENLRISNDTIARNLTAVRQVYGTVGLTDKDLELLIAARTVDEYSAKNLSDTIEGLKQFGALFINRLPAAKGTLARSALGNLKITTQGNELQIRTAVAQAEIAPLMQGL